MHIFTYCFPKTKDSSFLLFYFLIHETHVWEFLKLYLFKSNVTYVFLQMQCFHDITRQYQSFEKKIPLLPSAKWDKSWVTFFFDGQLWLNRGHEREGGKERIVKKKKKSLFRQRCIVVVVIVHRTMRRERIRPYRWSVPVSRETSSGGPTGSRRAFAGISAVWQGERACTCTCMMHMDRARRKSPERRKSYRVRWNDFVATLHRARCFSSPVFHAINISYRLHRC